MMSSVRRHQVLLTAPKAGETPEQALLWGLQEDQPCWPLRSSLLATESSYCSCFKAHDMQPFTMGAQWSQHGIRKGCYTAQSDSSRRKWQLFICWFIFIVPCVLSAICVYELWKLWVIKQSWGWISGSLVNVTHCSYIGPKFIHSQCSWRGTRNHCL